MRESYENPVNKSEILYLNMTIMIPLAGFHLGRGGGGGGGGICPPLPESPPPLEIRLALFLLKR